MVSFNGKILCTRLGFSSASLVLLGVGHAMHPSANGDQLAVKCSDDIWSERILTRGAVGIVNGYTQPHTL